MLLKKTLQANACFSMIFGLLLVAFPSFMAGLFGAIPAGIFMAIGLALLIFAADVFWISRQLPQAIARAQIIFWADIGWVALTPLVLWLFAASFSITGITIALEIAAIVAVFALLEWKGLQGLQQHRATSK
jgi:hypothetical protein